MRIIKNYAEMLFKSFMVVIITSFVFASCSKEKTESTPFIIEGAWQGKMTTEITGTENMFAIAIKKNGTLHRLKSDGTTIATGEWSLAGNLFSGFYVYPDSNIVTFTSTVDINKRKMNGMWSNSANSYGTLVATKKLTLRR
jgi:hypothetical protein